MKSLELKIPPPIVALLTAAAMWGLAKISPSLAVPHDLRIWMAVGIALPGIAFDIAGAVRFFRAKTTVNPLKPQKSSSLVTSGIYRLTRNPMYLGMLMALLGWCVYLSAPLAFLGPVFFMFYIGRFQIAPEERVLTSLFGDEYAAYCKRVRRWL